MKNEFQEILKQKLQAVDKPAQKTVSFVQSNPSQLSTELLTNLNPLHLSIQPKRAYWQDASKKQNTETKFAYAQTKLVKEESLSLEILGEFFNNESVRTAKIFFASVGDPIPQKISLEALKRSFRKLAKKLHPDMLGGQVEDFRFLKESYEILKNNWHSLEEKQEAA